VLAGTPYLERTLELISGTESRLRVVSPGDDAAALAVYGPVAGAQNVWEIDALLIAPTPERHAAQELLETVLDDARRSGARLVVAELPADPVLGRTLTLLRTNGFKQEARIADFHRDGVARLFLRRAP
jgi:hypothetical protein